MVQSKEKKIQEKNSLNVSSKEPRKKKVQRNQRQGAKKKDLKKKKKKKKKETRFIVRQIAHKGGKINVEKKKKRKFF